MISRLLPLAAASFLFTAAAQNPPAQAARGEAIFFESAKPVPCGTCHMLNNKGTGIAPDLARWSRLAPRAVGMAINATVTENVILAKVPARSDEFPAAKGKEEGDNITIYDLSKTPPEALTVAKKDLSAKANSSWKHPPSQAKLEAQQIADIIAYIRWVSYKDTKGVKADDVE